MSIVFSSFLLFFTIITSFLVALRTSAALSALHPDELKALGEIATTLGIERLKLNLAYGDPCALRRLKIDVVQKSGSDNIINCDCSFNNSMTCHIIDLFLKTLSLPGKLPPELVKLKYLQRIDLCRNSLSGSIPMEWASMQHLSFISVCANRLSGPLPSGLQNFKNLTFLYVSQMVS
uniref:Putative LRR receptor-like serine/threonine-protein kinase n=1 Tax=Noccaea caerulescens TaxID=107243 RepID=A0A1J3D1S6_NOCCA